MSADVLGYEVFAWNENNLGEFCIPSAVIGVCAGLMSAPARVRLKKGLRSQFVKGVVSWLRKLVVSRSQQGAR